MSRILMFLLLPFLAGAAEIDILDLLHGASAKNMEGAQGSWERSGKTVKFISTAAEGYMIYAGNSKFDPAVTPGKTYEAVADFEIKGDATGALMLSMPGGKRRPFPIRVLKESGKAVITFTARPDEKQVHFHAVVRGRGEVTLKSMTLKEFSPEEFNQLTVLKGSAKNHEGAAGTTDFRNGVVKFDKTNTAGYILFGGTPENDLPIVPGRQYEVAADFKVSDGAAGVLMIAMPGGKRRPFPQKRLNKSGRAVIIFTANPDENKLRLHLVVRGKGQVVCNSLTVRELSADPAAVNLNKLNGKKIAFLGDSITQAGNLGVGYINLVISGLSSAGVSAAKIPAGVSGNKSNQMLARLDSVLAKKPDILLLSCGVNDVWHGANGVKLPDYQRNITAIVEKAQAAGVEVCILTATMIKEDAGNAFNKQLIPYNEFLRQLAKEKNCLLVDLNDAMQKEVSGVKKVTPFAGDVLTVDGVHMNALGNIMMAKNILRAFGMSNEQLAAAEKMWDEEKFFINDRIVLSVGDYKKVFRKAAVSGKSVSDYLSELIRKDAE